MLNPTENDARLDTYLQSKSDFQQKLKLDIFSIIALSIKAFTKVKEHQYV